MDEQLDEREERYLTFFNHSDSSLFKRYLSWEGRGRVLLVLPFINGSSGIPGVGNIRFSIPWTFPARMETKSIRRINFYQLEGSRNWILMISKLS